uniref:Uncharacterized protein n=1 Tax=Rhizophora mucronata TaxID=61149 RepID=A0A2P2IQZ2_RHIMU
MCMSMCYCWDLFSTTSYNCNRLKKLYICPVNLCTWLPSVFLFCNYEFSFVTSCCQG